MKWLLSVCLVGAAAWGQSQPTPAPKPPVQVTPGTPSIQPASPATPATAEPAPAAPVKPDTVVASVKGKPVTAGEIETFLKGFPPQVRQSYGTNPREIMRQYLVFRYIAEIALQNKLDQQSPFKEQLNFLKTQVLWQAQINTISAELNAIPEDFNKYYAEHKDKYTQAKVRAIYIPFTATPDPPPPASAAKPDPKAKKPLTEAEAKTRAEEVVKLARAGKDFAELVKVFSEDPGSIAKGGELPPINKSDALPEPLKTVVFALKKDELSDPVKHTNGYYVFRGEGVTVQTLDQVRDQINQELKNERVRDWMTKTEKEADVKIEHEGFFAAPPKPPAQ